MSSRWYAPHGSLPRSDELSWAHSRAGGFHAQAVALNRDFSVERLGQSHRNIRPEGALAHYEGGYGSLVFTLYEDHISAKEGIDKHEIDLASIKTVKKLGSAIIIEYETESGKLERYGVTLMGDDDVLKAEGNTDLDRLVDLVNQLRGRDE